MKKKAHRDIYIPIWHLQFQLSLRVWIAHKFPERYNSQMDIPNKHTQLD